MATSKNTICNMALAELASTLYVTNIDSPSTKEEKYCALFFPQALDYFLTLDSWSAAWHDQKISYNDPMVLDADEMFTYEYDLPADPYCVKPLRILENPKAEFVVKARRLYCNIQYDGQITLHYNKRVTTFNHFSAVELHALALLLSYFLVGPLAKGRKNAKMEQWGFFINALDQARGTNAAMFNTKTIDYQVMPEPPDMESESWFD